MANNEQADDLETTSVHRNGGHCVDPAVENFVNDFLKEQLRKNGYNWTSTVRHNTPRTIETEVGSALRSLADEFTSQYKEQFNEMCGQLTLSDDTVKPTVEGVANELFSEGIKWARIVAFFVFGSELAIHCKETNAHELINILAHSISVYVTEKLLPWINHHGGWIGLIQFNEEGKGRQPNRWPSVKNLLCLGISAIGAITLGAVLTKS